MSLTQLSASTEVRGTADTDGGAYSPSRSILLVLTHDFIITQLYGLTGGEEHGWFERRGRWFAHQFRCRLRRRGCYMFGATSSQLTVPLYELPPARLVIHRQTSAHERRKGTWLWVMVKPHISSARHEEAVAREGGRYAHVCRVSGSEPLSLRTHRHRGRSRPLRSAVVEKQAPSVAV